VPALITGQNIQDGTVTSRDLHNGTITDRDLALDSVHLRNLTDRAQALFRVGAAPPRITDYQDLAPIAARKLPYGGYYVVFTEFLATNTGATDDSLNCAYKVAGTVSGAAGVQAAAEASAKAQSVTVVHATKPGQIIRFVCQRNGSSSFDLSAIRFAAFRFG
jgi:hypothetical protein